MPPKKSAMTKQATLTDYLAVQKRVTRSAAAKAALTSKQLLQSPETTITRPLVLVPSPDAEERRPAKRTRINFGLPTSDPPANEQVATPVLEPAAPAERIERALKLLESPKKGPLLPTVALSSPLSPARTTQSPKAATPTKSSPLKTPTASSALSLRDRLNALNQKAAEDSPRKNLLSQFKTLREPASSEQVDPYRLPHLADLHASPAKALATGTPAAPSRRPMSYRHVVPPSQRIPLPKVLDHLDQVFDALEYTIMYQRGRDERAVFHRLQRTVEGVCGRSFTLEHLQQIVHLFPEAYMLEAVKIMHQAQRVNSWSLDFNVTWSRKRKRDHGDEGLLSSSPARATPAPQSVPSTPTPVMPSTPSPSRTVPRQVPTTPRRSDDPDGTISKVTFAALEMPRRRTEFRARLVRYVARVHMQWLEKRAPNWQSPVDLDLERGALVSVPISAKSPWHPQFNLDKDVPQIPLAELPQYLPALGAARKVAIPTAASVRAAQQQATAASASAATQQSPASPSPKSPPNIQKRFGRLLERTKRKEEARKHDPVLGLTSDQMRARTQLARLPAIVDILTTTLTGKPVAPLAQIAQKIADSYPTPMSPASAAEHVEALAQTVPVWCSVVEIGRRKFVRLAPDTMEIAEVKRTIERAKDEIKPDHSSQAAE